MATLQQLEGALIKAHRAGDVRAATLFSKHIKSARSDPANLIPDVQIRSTMPKQEEPSLWDRLVGTGEAAVSAITGMTSGQLGMAGGALSQAGKEMMSGQFGGYPAARRIEEEAMKSAQSRTYMPRTESGQQQTQALGEIAGNYLMPLAGLGPELSALSSLSKPAKTALLTQMAQRRTPLPASASQGMPRSVGSANLAPEVVKQQASSELPVPIDLMKHQRLTGDEAFIRSKEFSELAKHPLGGPLRAAATKQREQIYQNFDAFIDQTGAQVTDLKAAGTSLDRVLFRGIAKDKTIVKRAYERANNSSEAKAPVVLQNTAKLLNENPDLLEVPIGKKAAVSSAGPGFNLMETLRRDDGSLMFEPKQATIYAAEKFRQRINKMTGFDPNDQRVATMLKKAIDADVDEVGGKPYQKARSLRAAYGKRWENFQLIKDLTKFKRGTDTRAIALRDIFDRTIIRAPLEETQKLFNLTRKLGPEGVQAVNDMKGATIEWVKEKTFSNTSRDAYGNPVPSPAQFKKAMATLENDGKLDFLLDGKTANGLRLLKDVADDILLMPPGATNPSGTASAAAVMFDFMLSGVLDQLLPVATATKVIKTYLQGRPVKKFIKEELRPPQ